MHAHIVVIKNVEVFGIDSYTTAANVRRSLVLFHLPRSDI
jgi:hypothetical protein